jgi:hypothetical protein
MAVFDITFVACKMNEMVLKKSILKMAKCATTTT